MAGTTGNAGDLNLTLMTSQGVVSDLMREVIPKVLWIGNAFDARDVAAVLNLGVSAVIDLAMEEPPVQYPRDIVYCRLPLVDGEGNPPGVLRAAIETTARFVENGIPTLVSCSGGMSRSPAIVAAALSRMQAETPDEAMRRLVVSGPHDVSASLWAEVKEVNRVIAHSLTK